MNTDAIEQAGLTPLEPQLSAIDGIKSRSDLASVLGSRLRADVDPINATNFHTDHLFGLFVTQGLEDAIAEHRLPAAGRPGHAQPRLLPVRRRRP